MTLSDQPEASLLPGDDGEGGQHDGQDGQLAVMEESSRCQVQQCGIIQCFTMEFKTLKLMSSVKLYEVERPKEIIPKGRVGSVTSARVGGHLLCLTLIFPLFSASYYARGDMRDESQ